MRVVRHELLVGAVAGGHGRLNKVDEFGRGRARRKVKVEAAVHGTHADGGGVGAPPQNGLLQVKKSAFVADVLADLDGGGPRFGVCGRPGAAQTLVRLHHVLHHAPLLQRRPAHDFPLDGELDFEAAGVGFGPDEARVDQSNFGEAANAAHAQLEQGRGFGGGGNPVFGGLEVAFAGWAPEEGDLLGGGGWWWVFRVSTVFPFFDPPSFSISSHLLRQRFRNVDLGPDAGDAHVGRVGQDGRAAEAAEAVRR